MTEENYNYCCNLCSWNGSAFLERDASLVCPDCFSRQRHRSLYKYLKDSGRCKGERCLDVASRRIIQRRLSYNEYINIDKAPGRAELTMDISDLKFNDNTFDLIICCSVLQFVSNYQKAITEMKRVLKEESICIIQVPYDKSIESTQIINTENNMKKNGSGHSDHCVRFAYQDILNRLNEVFIVETYLYNDPLYAFSQNEIFVCFNKPG